MPRKPLDSEHETVTCTIRLTIGTRNELDRLRGTTSRSEYLRKLIDLAIGQRTLQEAYPDEQPEVKPAKKLRVIPEKRHRHRFVKGEQPVRFEMRGRLRVPIYRYECEDPECSEAKEG
jgi:hypothetical protein